MTGRGEAPGRLSVWSWVVYDLANTIFALGVIGRYFPEWLISVGQPDSALALVEAGAGALVIFLAPWAGARSDVRGARVPTLAVTTVLCVAATALLASGPVSLSLALLGLALVAFNVGSVVYDALLVDVSTPANRGRISVREVAGPPGAPTLVLLHGLAATGRLNWAPAVPALNGARPPGLEPGTVGLEIRCSVQLSYGRMVGVAGFEPAARSTQSYASTN